MSGLDLLRRIRQDWPATAVRFIMITADPNPQLPAALRSLGANGFLMKPFSPEALRQTIERAFESAER